jgi:hypothetical protein
LESRPSIDTQNVDLSRSCCREVMGTGLMGGTGFFGLTGKDFCDVGASRGKVDDYKKCCGLPRGYYGYCK